MTTFGHLGHDLITGTEESQRAARAERRREDRLRIAHKNGWPELRRTDLKFGRHYVEHVPTGGIYHPMNGEVALGKTTVVDQQRLRRSDGWLDAK